MRQSAVRLVLAAWNVAMTAASFTLFTWIVHDRRMPGWPSLLDRVEHGPLLRMGGGTLGATIADMLLFAGFGLFHSALARPAASALISGRLGLVSRQALRTFYMTVTAATWLLVIFFWQHTGVTVWDLRPGLERLGIDRPLVDTYAPLVPFAFVLLCLGAVARHGLLRFVGLRQLFTPPEQLDETGDLRLPSARDGQEPRLLTTGVYGVVRHPIYTYLLAAVVARPVMSLDLVIFGAAAVAFLCLAIPREEEKLLALFGEQYQAYRQTTPAFVPFWPAGRGSR